MASLKEIKTRIASVKSTLKITSAMKLVASAKLRKAQAAISGALPYEQKLHNILGGLLQDDDLRKALHDELGFGGEESAPVLQDISSDQMPSKERVRRVALVLFSSNSSLCGAFNSNIARKYNSTMEELYRSGYSDEDIDVYAVGRKVAEAVVKSSHPLKKDWQLAAAEVNYDSAVEIASCLVDSFIAGEVGHIILIYSHFASASSQPVIRENYLPLSLDSGTGGEEPVDYILEPDPLSIVKTLLPMVLFLKIFTVLLDANAAEHAARTIAMQVASDNASDLLSELTLSYNKGRQSEITAEILDLASGMMN